ncbi:apolipoprotein N-acyltransferase [Methylocella sp. CPCC 101449]|uniref:apolipoprotein N-acyltransferase n=1 Tax=Methylocella sp. CPCC 101449 TaxID=2987531 RepID=UPI00288D5724|nr:apolipoprotein N-acyltransferase [Methylocella sp. CPCC 101449]MDT2020407.1 apolipoprotein N-acyltransferase [Methylocella sp. CPCC 101449]
MTTAAITRTADRFVLSAGWTRAFLAFACGAAGALAMPPVSLFPFLCISMVAAVWLIDGSAAQVRAGVPATAFAHAMDAAKVGWWLGFGYHVAGLWWLGAAFLVEADQFAWALPLGVIGLPAGLAFFTAFGFFLARLCWTTGPSRILVLALALTVSEWLRGTLLTGFPWNDFGMAFGANLMLAQTASLIGLYGLTFIAVFICAAPAVLADRPARGRRGPWPVFAALILLIIMVAFGFWRSSAPPVAAQPNVKLRIMQPNLPQDEKFRSDNKEAILKRYFEVSDRATSPQTAGVADATHLIWPESAFPFILSRDPAALREIGTFLPASTILVTGAARFEQFDRTAGSRRPAGRYYNSIQAVLPGGAIVATYDKVHLVPFGEYLPLGWLLDKVGLRQFVHIPGGFEPGARRTLLRLPGLPAAAPLVCYEAIFPGEVMPQDGSAERPEFMLNVTNDGWFGETSGPYQHLMQARLRAIEEGMPLVRAANTGISAIIDPYGRILKQLPLGVDGVIDSSLPKPIAAPFFAQHSQSAPAGLWFAALILALALRAWEKRRSTYTST